MGADGGRYYGGTTFFLTVSEYKPMYFEPETEEGNRIRESRPHGPQKKKGKGKVKRW